MLDFGQPVMLTDIIMPSCQDLASLSIDVWLHNEETDGQRLVITSDISHKALVLNDLMPPPVCRFLKVRIVFFFISSMIVILLYCFLDVVMNN